MTKIINSGEYKEKQKDILVITEGRKRLMFFAFVNGGSPTMWIGDAKKWL